MDDNNPQSNLVGRKFRGMINRYLWFDISLYIIIDRKRRRLGHNYSFNNNIHFDLNELFIMKTSFRHILRLLILKYISSHIGYSIIEHLNMTYCVLSVNAAEVIEEGRLRPLMISCHCFLLMTSTKPPRPTTRLYNS